MPEAIPNELSLDGMPTLWMELKLARQARLDWEKIEKDLITKIQAKLTEAGAEVATLHGKPVVQWKATKRFAEGRFADERPELAEQYREGKVVYKINTSKLQATNPDLYQQYLVRQFTVIEE